MLNWGVIPMLTDAPSSTDDMFEIAERKQLEAGLVQSGDDVVIVAVYQLGFIRTNNASALLFCANLTLQTIISSFIACVMIFEMECLINRMGKMKVVY